MHLNPKIICWAVAGIVGATIFAVLRFSSPNLHLLGIGLQSYTNANATFTLTNFSQNAGAGPETVAKRRPTGAGMRAGGGSMSARPYPHERLARLQDPDGKPTEL